MKLSAFSTAASKKATAKLSHQTHKATVAAGKEPRLLLGIVNLAIDQEQSKGDTSVVKEALEDPKRIYKVLCDLSETIGEHLEISNLRKRIDGLAMRYKAEITLDLDLAVKDAVTLMRNHDGKMYGSASYRRLSNGASALGNHLSAMSSPMSSFLIVYEQMINEQFTASPIFEEAKQAVETLDAVRARLSYHIDAMAVLVSFLEDVIQLKTQDPFVKKMQVSTLKLVGIPLP